MAAELEAFRKRLKQAAEVGASPAEFFTLYRSGVEIIPMSDFDDWWMVRAGLASAAFNLSTTEQRAAIAVLEEGLADLAVSGEPDSLTRTRLGHPRVTFHALIAALYDSDDHGDPTSDPQAQEAAIRHCLAVVCDEHATKLHLQQSNEHLARLIVRHDATSPGQRYGMGLSAFFHATRLAQTRDDAVLLLRELAQAVQHVRLAIDRLGVVPGLGFDFVAFGTSESAVEESLGSASDTEDHIGVLRLSYSNPPVVFEFERVADQLSLAAVRSEECLLNGQDITDWSLEDAKSYLRPNPIVVHRQDTTFVHEGSQALQFEFEKKKLKRLWAVPMTDSSNLRLLLPRRDE